MPAGWRLLIDDDCPVGTVDLGADPAPFAAFLVGARLFRGYAGWESGQLEDEIDEGSWYVVPGRGPGPDIGRSRRTVAAGAASPRRCAGPGVGLPGRPGDQLNPVRPAVGLVRRRQPTDVQTSDGDVQTVRRGRAVPAGRPSGSATVVPQQLDQGPGGGRRQPAAALGHADPAAGEPGHRTGWNRSRRNAGMAVAGRMAGP